VGQEGESAYERKEEVGMNLGGEREDSTPDDKRNWEYGRRDRPSGI